MAFKERLKEARLSKKITQEQLGREIGVAKSTIAGYEKGSSEPDMAKLEKIMRVLKIDANYLLQDELTPNENHVSGIEMVLIKKYRTLDRYGKEAVDSVLKVEHTRCTTPTEETESNVIYFNTPEYLQPVSAGTGDWIDDDSFRNLLLTKQPPRGTSFIVRVHGDSMEPTYCDGDRLFIRSQNTLEDGQIGIFCMDSKMYVKELRGNYLISHNADENPPRPLTEDVVCQGRVLGVCTEDYFEE